MQNIINFLIFASLGVTFEVVATAIINLFSKRPRDWRLLGYANLWVFVAYGLSYFIFPQFSEYLVDNSYPVIARFIIYGIIFFHVEFFYCLILQKTINACPWNYNDRCAVTRYRDIPILIALAIVFPIKKLTGKQYFKNLTNHLGHGRGLSALCNIPAYGLFGLLLEKITDILA